MSRGENGIPWPLIVLLALCNLGRWQVLASSAIEGTYRANFSVSTTDGFSVRKVHMSEKCQEAPFDQPPFKTEAEASSLTLPMKPISVVDSIAGKGYAQTCVEIATSCPSAASPVESCKTSFAIENKPTCAGASEQDVGYYEGLYCHCTGVDLVDIQTDVFALQRAEEQAQKSVQAAMLAPASQRAEEQAQKSVQAAMSGTGIVPGQIYYGTDDNDTACLEDCDKKCSATEWVQEAFMTPAHPCELLRTEHDCMGSMIFLHGLPNVEPNLDPNFPGDGTALSSHSESLGNGCAFDKSGGVKHWKQVWNPPEPDGKLEKTGVCGCYGTPKPTIT